MSFKEAITSVFNNYANFSGRARRSEYWYWYLFTMIVNGVLNAGRGAAGDGTAMATLFTVLSSIVALGFLIPGLAVAWRRMHDIGKSGGWIFIALVPIIGWILVLIWLFKDSDPGENQYGPNPKEVY